MANPSTTPVYLASIALSANSGNIDTAADVLAEYYEVLVSAKYAAVAGTSGISIQTYYSTDGTTFVQNPASAQVLAPAANVLGSLSIRVGSKSTLGTIQKIRVKLTNLDGTNAAVCTVSLISHKE